MSVNDIEMETLPESMSDDGQSEVVSKDKVIMDAIRGMQPPWNYEVLDTNCNVETYSGSYSCLGGLERLIHVGDICKQLRITAYTAAMFSITKMNNVKMYKKLHKKIQLIKSEGLLEGHEALPSYDEDWIQVASDANDFKLSKLEGDLNYAFAINAKDCIRRALNDLGDFYLDIGCMKKAYTTYSQMESYCSSSNHVVNMTQQVMSSFIYAKNWVTLKYLTDKVRYDVEMNKDNYKVTFLVCAIGLGDLQNGDYEMAANYFLLSDSFHNDYPEMLTATDVGIYASLCALATFNRERLETEIITSTSFKPYLDLLPDIRELITLFQNADYRKFVILLKKKRNDLLLDVYLVMHVDRIYQMIYQRGIENYTNSFAAISFIQLSEEFDLTIGELKHILSPMIANRRISGYIDSEDELLYIDKRKQKPRPRHSGKKGSNVALRNNNNGSGLGGTMAAPNRNNRPINHYIEEFEIMPIEAEPLNPPIQNNRAIFPPINDYRARRRLRLRQRPYRPVSSEDDSNSERSQTSDDCGYLAEPESSD